MSSESIGHDQSDAHVSGHTGRPEAPSRGAIDTSDFFSRSLREFQAQLADLEARIDPSAQPAVDRHLDDLASAMCASGEACARLERALATDRDALGKVRARFLEATEPWFKKSWFMARARHKPLGYPGDYVMLEGIYDNEPKSLGLGGYFDLYFLRSTLACAVRERLAALERFLCAEAERRAGAYTILSVASGPSRELRRNARWLREEISVVCLDNDQEALAWTRQALGHPPSVRFVKQNALRLLSGQRNIRTLGAFDVIYSVGLFDYIADAPLVAMVRGLRETLTETGMLLISFKDSQRYDRHQYEWHVDWHFVQRTEAHCHHLLTEAGVPLAKRRLLRDATGIMLLFECKA